jgi:hypothetical protein
MENTAALWAFPSNRGPSPSLRRGAHFRFRQCGDPAMELDPPSSSICRGALPSPGPFSCCGSHCHHASIVRCTYAHVFFLGHSPAWLFSLSSSGRASELGPRPTRPASHCLQHRRAINICSSACRVPETVRITLGNGPAKYSTLGKEDYGPSLPLMRYHFDRSQPRVPCRFT